MNRNDKFDKGILAIEDLTFTEIVAIIHACYDFKNEVNNCEYRIYDDFVNGREVMYDFGMYGEDTDEMLTSNKGPEYVKRSVRIAESKTVRRAEYILAAAGVDGVDTRFDLGYLQAATHNKFMNNLFKDYRGKIKTEAGMDIVHKCLCIQLLHRGSKSEWLTPEMINDLINKDKSLNLLRKKLNEMIDVLSVGNIYKYRWYKDTTADMKTFNMSRAVKYAKSTFVVTDDMRHIVAGVLLASVA